MKAQQGGEAGADRRQQHSNGVRNIQCSSVSCVCLAPPWRAMVKAWRSAKARRAQTVDKQQAQQQSLATQLVPIFPNLRLFRPTLAGDGERLAQREGQARADSGQAAGPASLRRLFEFVFSPPSQLCAPTLAGDGEGLAQHKGQARAHRAQQRAQQLLRGGAGDALRRSRRRLVGGNAARLERQQQVGRTLPWHCGKR